MFTDDERDTLQYDFDHVVDMISELEMKLNDLSDEVDKLKKWAEYNKSVMSACNEMWNQCRDDNYWEFYNKNEYGREE